ncbi:MAG: hypothetical protein ABR969_10020 [Sedimentisphaerales bacterium]
MNKYLYPVFIILVAACTCSAVTSKIIRHKTFDNFSKGKIQDTIISSRGTITLAAASQILAQDFNDVWSINSIACKDDDSVYIGTSPNGRIYKYKDGKTVCIYPADLGKSEKKQSKEPNESNDPNEPNEPNKPPKIAVRKHIANEHVFKLAFDSHGDLLAAISGAKCRLLRYDGKKFETVFEPNKTSYIFAIALDKAGNVFLGTGPKGRIWKLDSKCRNPQLVYTCQDKNIMCLLVGKNGFLYAGTDTRGLVYKINLENKTASILYDSGENEVTDLLFGSDGFLYAAATSYKSIKAQMKGVPEPQRPLALGKPESKEPSESSDSAEAEEQGISLKTANSPQESLPPPSPVPPELERGRPSSSASHVYRIDPNGFVIDVFSETAVFFTMYMQKDQILLGTGNKAQMFAVNPKTETDTMIYEDKTSSQITDIKKFGNDVVFATANPPKLIKLKSAFAPTGDFQSALIDAGQPAQWGKLQIEADIPADTKILVSARTGNVEDINDPTFSSWTQPVKITEPLALAVPLGRFLQYKLILDGTNTAAPVIREVAVAYMIPNIAPRVMDITIGKAEKNASLGTRKIDFKAEDENGDKLIYQIDFRKKGRTGWIKLIDDLEKASFDWDTKTIEDGFYELKVTASDRLSNNLTSALTGSRISEPITIDNTPPAIEKHELKITGHSAVLTLTVTDEFSIISAFNYTVDSNDDWISVLPDDNVFDTITENFTIKLQDLKPGQHVLAINTSDAEGNIRYKTFEIDIK